MVDFTPSSSIISQVSLVDIIAVNVITKIF